ncbi:peptidoglycan glycosyltransferase [Asticcacaulis sp. AC460]|uniref:peptidoglycan D,D-transpeptidase FtsI family protein n=1 Tax=Asticcacaulis sp. AC460 TaxID=1282360 RepID=UPI0003C407B8|nr:penicillin-binding protein 2 [Asticcacaulis sp. AC460]ESQ93538.1 peptidoglycan glycosyltransferase [Asticcacaulis sp. AC460]
MRVSLFETTQSGFQWVADRVWKVEHAFERANAANKKATSTRMRIFAVLCGLSFAYAILMLFAARASLSGSPGNMAALTGEPNARAQLVDRNGQLLATDVNDYSLFVDPTDMTAEDRGMVRQALTQIFPSLPREDIAKVFGGGKRMLLTNNLKAAERERILNYGLPGISFEAQLVRDYPLGETGAAYIGMTQRGGDGLSGAEKALQDDIKKTSVNNAPVALAMDLRVQGALENELRAVAMDQRAEDAIGIVTNVRTGEILAMASWPEFDLNKPGSYSEQAKRNHAAVDRYELGSIFKAISVGIGLDTGTASMNSVYDARQPLVISGRKIHDDHAVNAMIGLEDVFIKSSNIGTGQLALTAGAGNFTRYYEALGLFRSADTELTEPAAPLYPKKWTDLSLVQTAFGQGMAITPLSFAEAIGGLLNGGYRRPLTIKKYDGTSPIAGTRVFSAATSRTMLDLMRSNVIKGTGSRANAPGLRVGGKTGTAQKPENGRYGSNRISSFAAVFPTDGPLDGDRYLVLVIFDSPQGGPSSSGLRTGGFVAAPVAGRVIDRVAPFLGVQRKEDKFTSAQWDKAPVAPEDATGDE